MDEKTYNAVKEMTFDAQFYKDRPVALCEVASWAIWNSSNLSDTEIIEKSIEKLQPNIVFVLINFAGNGDLYFDNPTWKTWQNFHSYSKMDTRIYNVLSNSDYKGAYLTDIIKCVPTKNNTELDLKIKNGEIDMKKQAGIFIDELNILNTDSIKLYLCGRFTENIFAKHIQTDTNYYKIKNKIKSYQYVIHPSLMAIRNDEVFYSKIRNQLRIK